MLGLLLDVTQTSVWDINILSDNVGGVTPVEIGNFRIHAEKTGLGAFDISGQVPATFDESAQQLHIDETAQQPPVGVPGLTASNVSGCFGLIANGDARRRLPAEQHRSGDRRELRLVSRRARSSPPQPAGGGRWADKFRRTSEPGHTIMCIVF